MSVIDLPILPPGQLGITPEVLRMVVTDDLETVLAPGYLNGQNLQGIDLQDGQLIDLTYSANPQTKVGTTQRFIVSNAVDGTITVNAHTSNGVRVVSGESGVLGSGTTFYTIFDSRITFISDIIVNIVSLGVDNPEPILNIDQRIGS